MKRKTEAGIGARLAGMAGAWARERLIDINYRVVGRLNSRIWRVVWWLDSHKQVEHYVDKWRTPGAVPRRGSDVGTSPLLGMDSGAE